jgi:hypothetical protein
MDGKASGEAFLVFHNRDGIERALKMDKEKLGSR